MPSILNKLKDKLTSKPKSSSTSDPLVPPTRLISSVHNWVDDTFDDLQRRSTDPLSTYTTRRFFTLPGGFRLALQYDGSSPRSYRDHISINHRSYDLHNHNSIYDPTKSRDPFFPPLSDDRLSRSHRRERGARDAKDRRSEDHHSRRRRKSSHPKEFSRHRASDARLNYNLASIPDIPSRPSLPVFPFGAAVRNDDHGRREEAERLEKEKERSRRQHLDIQKWTEKDDQKLRQYRKELREYLESEEQKRAGKEEEKRKESGYNEASKAPDRLARQHMEEERARRRRERSDRETKDAGKEQRDNPQAGVTPLRANATGALTRVNLKAATESAEPENAEPENARDSDSKSDKSELNRAIGNMQRTYLEGIQPAENVARV